MRISDWASARIFSAVHNHHLVYNTCWEDPRLDRIALNLGADDTVLVITSAGCNALDYALQAPRHVYAVDMNPRQNALLELKLAGIRNLAYEEFFALFGKGRLAHADAFYRARLRSSLSPYARDYWDRRIGFFLGKGIRKSFYYHGSSGLFAQMVNWYVDRVAKVRESIEALLWAQTLEEQHDIYHRVLRSAIWTRFMRRFVANDATLSLLGVPRPQRQQVERYYPGGIARFIEDCLEAVFARLPIHDNYFWRVYMTGSYTETCCPEYLRRENFLRLKQGLVDRISVHTNTVQGFLEAHDSPISRYVLLDHMDWLSTFKQPLLAGEWQAIIDRAAPGARVIWRSGGTRVEFVDPLLVAVNGCSCRVGDLLTYHRELAEDLHRNDRVHTYGSFYIADLAAA